MRKLGNILKINFLSILALPLLLIATVSKLIARAFDKAVIILKMLLIMSVIAIAFEVMKNPGSLLEAIAYLIVALLIGGIFIAILFWIIGIISAFLAVIWEFIIALFEGIYNLSFSGYLKLSEICETSFQIISLKGRKAANGFYCLFYMLLKAVNKLISGIVSLSFALSVLLSVGLVFGSLLYANIKVSEAFGLNIFQYLGKFDTFSVIYGTVLYVVFIAAGVIILISLGMEWYEWSKELRMTSEEYTEYIRQLQENKILMEENANADNTPNDTTMIYAHSLETQMGTVESLSHDIDTLQSQKENALLRSYWGDYLRDLMSLAEECNSYKTVSPQMNFKK